MKILHFHKYDWDKNEYEVNLSKMTKQKQQQFKCMKELYKFQSSWEKVRLLVVLEQSEEKN